MNSDANSRQVRIDLAACHRLIDHFGMSDLIFTHVTARSPDRDEAFLINRYGQLFDEIRASELVEIDASGQVLSGEGPVNPSGFAIHAAIHRACRDAFCVIHTHSVAGIALSACRAGLLPLSQHAMKFHGRLAYHDYEGIVLGDDEGARLATALGKRQAAVLRNHGLLAIGRTVAEAFHVIYHLEIACRVQLRVLAACPDPSGMLTPGPETAERVARQFEAFPQPLGRREWPALLRLLDRTSPDYRE
ncbi:class II aldolase/adducin family protein [Burkholderia plantarii]|uniref:Class II aldolase/adducin family protein n=1 Tax=Burkholderia plantarii TaxID=41899 RepID=A0A0B6S6P0_BURPL|nr:class II aldolase/adducin family protein [Burkholderia plantarii]AJK50124.1 class II aldolase/adducin family protein [Burkholderia plantarii]